MKTIKARILVAVTDDGYAAEGDSLLTAKQLTAAMTERVNGEGWGAPIIYHWVEVDLPLPAKTRRAPIKGRVKT